MHWITVALLAPFIWSLINHIDKYLISKYFKGGGIGGLMVFVGIISILLLPFIYLIDPTVLSLTPKTILTLIATGILYNIAVLFYLYALEEDDASTIVPFWQLAPVFTYFLSILFLEEYLSGSKIIASLIVIVGAIILSLKFDGAKTYIKKRVVWMMICSSFALALGNVWFRDGFTDTISFWVSMFWNQVGMMIFGFSCLLVKKYREQFFLTLKNNSRAILGINLLEQIFEIVGVIINNYAILLAPVAMVILLEYSAQPTFVFIEGIILTLLFPNFIKEDISKKNLIIKAIAIGIMSIGVYLLI